MPKNAHEANKHAKDFQEPTPNEKEIPKKGYQMEKSSLGRYQFKYTTWNEISIDTHTKRKMSNSQKREWFQTTKRSTKFHDGTKQVPKRNCLCSTNTHLIRITR